MEEDAGRRDTVNTLERKEKLKLSRKRIRGVSDSILSGTWREFLALSADREPSQ